MPHKILFVCLGNICRSPAAEGVFLHKIKEKGIEENFIVDSAGTSGYHQGEQADARMQMHAERRGIVLPNLSRKIFAEDLAKFDLILAMDSSNFDDICSLDRGEEYRSKIRMFMDFGRGEGSLNVPDPYYGGAAGFDTVLDMVEEASEGLIKHLEDGGN